MRKILVVAAHPDDEILGCGGSMRAHRTAGHAVRTVIVAQGLAARGAIGEAELEAHRTAARQANARVGVDQVIFGDFPDNAMDTVALLTVAKFIEAQIRDFQPDTIYTHHPHDLNVDHRVVSQAVATACRAQPGAGVDTILFFEVASSTEWQLDPTGAAFVPNWFVEISTCLDDKIQALSEYAHEMRPWPHTRSYEAVRHLAHWRGATVGVEAAEAFVLARRISRGARPDDPAERPSHHHLNSGSLPVENQ